MNILSDKGFRMRSDQKNRVVDSVFAEMRKTKSASDTEQGHT